MLTSPMARPTRTGPVVALIGVVVALALVGVLEARGPSWAPATAAPWSGGWMAQVRDHLR